MALCMNDFRYPNQDTDTSEEAEGNTLVRKPLHNAESSTRCSGGEVGGRQGRSLLSSPTPAESVHPGIAALHHESCFPNDSTYGGDFALLEKHAQSQASVDDEGANASDLVATKSSEIFHGEAPPCGCKNITRDPSLSSNPLEAVPQLCNTSDPQSRLLSERPPGSQPSGTAACRKEDANVAPSGSHRTGKIHDMPKLPPTSIHCADLTGGGIASGCRRQDEDDEARRLPTVRGERSAPAAARTRSLGDDKEEGEGEVAQLSAALETLVQVCLTRCPCSSLLQDLGLSLHNRLQQHRSEIENQVRCLESQLHGFKAVLDNLQLRQLRMETMPGSGFTSDVDTASLTSSVEDESGLTSTSTCASSTASMASQVDVRDVRNGETGEIPQKEAMPRQPDHCAWIQDHIVTLLGNLDLSNSLLLPHLVADGVLTETDEEEIFTHRTRKDQVRELLLKLRRSSREKFDTFRQSLQAEYPHLARLPFHNTETGESEASSQRCVTCDVTRRVALIDVMDPLFSQGAISSRVYEQLWRGTSSSRLEWRRLLDEMNARDPRLSLQVLVEALEKKHPDLSQRLLRSGMDTFMCLCHAQVKPLLCSSLQASGQHGLGSGSSEAIPDPDREITCAPSSSAALPQNLDAVCSKTETAAANQGKLFRGDSLGASGDKWVPPGEPLLDVSQANLSEETVPKQLAREKDAWDRSFVSVGELQCRDDRRLTLTEADKWSAESKPVLGGWKRSPRFRVIIRPKGRNVHYTQHHRRYNHSHLHLQT